MLNKKGQNTAEYAILIALVIAAAVGMQTYVKRGVQARMRDETRSFTSALNSSDAETNWASINASTNATMSSQYEPDKLSKQSTQQIIADTENSTMTAGGEVTREMNKTTTQNATDYQKYGY